ncbi:hypothetical protein BD626DRAFT_41113 [Schizophyllum amplum]|uniref:Uncharacterized protein n=1 Tax=Schizophyllum amplum TaxID=97359 RepID=A0A550CDE9_9AGAR|nr:hypothetical protein BD626DRAFT_41113 [Auriculariopsis ampla]
MRCERGAADTTRCAPCAEARSSVALIVRARLTSDAYPQLTPFAPPDAAMLNDVGEDRPAPVDERLSSRVDAQKTDKSEKRRSWKVLYRTIGASIGQLTNQRSKADASPQQNQRPTLTSSQTEPALSPSRASSPSRSSSPLRLSLSLSRATSLSSRPTSPSHISLPETSPRLYNARTESRTSLPENTLLRLSSNKSHPQQSSEAQPSARLASDKASHPSDKAAPPSEKASPPSDEAAPPSDKVPPLSDEAPPPSDEARPRPRAARSESRFSLRPLRRPTRPSLRNILRAQSCERPPPVPSIAV